MRKTSVTPSIFKAALPALLSLLLALPAAAALQPGDAAPDFTLPASLAGQDFRYSFKEALAKGPVVVYFYPSAYTGGCNLQARHFALNSDSFAAAGASVIGVSQDSIARLNRFSADPAYCGGKVAVASDADGQVSRGFDLAVTERAGRTDTRGEAIDHAFVERTTFVVTPDGKVAATVTGLAPQANVERALAIVQQLAAGKARRP